MSRMFGPLPPAEDAAEEMADYLRRVGVVIPEAQPIGIRLTAEGASEDVDEATVAAMTDDERDDFDGVIFTPDVPNIDELAVMLVHMARERPERFPHRWSWRRWKLTSRFAGFLYVSGLSSSGGSSTSAGSDPVGGWIYSLPRWSSFSPRRQRTYMLGHYRPERHGY
jgi:hypothetical protein